MTVASISCDCRGESVAKAVSTIIDRFNALESGARFEACVDAYPADFRISLLEAGARHVAKRTADGAWQLTVTRGLAPAQGAVPGVHHVVSDGVSVWTSQRGTMAARIDVRTRRVVAKSAVARKASHLALDAGAGRLFIADAAANKVLALRASDLTIEQSWDAPGMPQLPLVSAEGIVCVTGPATGTLTIARPHFGTFVAQTLVIGHCPHDPLLDVTGEYVFVPCAGSNELVKVRLRDAEIVGRIAVGDGPAHLALHPDGTRVYAANSWDGTVTCLSIDGERIADNHSGGWAHAIDVTADGRRVCVANFLDDTLAVFDAGTLKRVAELATDAYPHGLDVSRDDGCVIATGFASKYVRIYDASAQREIARVEIGLGSSHTAFASGVAFIGCSVSDHIACIDLATLSLVDRVRIQ